MRGARPTVHIVEPGGRGGVYQHSLALAAVLAESGLAVRLHTANDCEVAPDSAIELCGCVEWYRGMGAPGRRLSIVGGYLAHTLPHLLNVVGPQDPVHLQGVFKVPLTALTAARLRVRGRRVVFSPHNTFSRRGSRLEGAVLRRIARGVDAVMVFSQADARELAAWGCTATVVPLAQTMPLKRELAKEWRRRWDVGPATSVALFAGQIRRDKRLDLALEAASRWQADCVLAVVGEDLGDLARCREIASAKRLPVRWHVGYAPLEEFVAAIAAADVLLCPYRQASQSGVLALAAQLGVRSVATDVGGLSELATIALEDDDPDSVAKAVDRVLGTSAPEPAGSGAGLLRAHLSAYGLE